jgi:hypothetical protein
LGAVLQRLAWLKQLFLTGYISDQHTDNAISKHITFQQLSALNLIRELIATNVRDIDMSLAKLGVFAALLDVLLAHSSHSIIASSITNAILSVLEADDSRGFVIEHLLRECSLCARLRENFASNIELRPFAVKLANALNECDSIKLTLMHDTEWVAFVALSIEPINVLNFNADVQQLLAQQVTNSPNLPKNSEFSEQRWNDFTFLISY